VSESFTFDFQQILPDVILSFFGIIILVADPFVSRPRKASLGIVGLLGIVGAALATVNMTGNDIVAVFSGMIIVDRFSLFFRFAFLLISGLTLLASLDYLKKQNLNLAEYYALVLFATVGMNLMAASNELIMVFLGLETLSISCYILLGIRRADPRSNESALKYFLLGSFSSAFFLYGIAMAYGATRTTNLEIIAARVLDGSANVSLIYLAASLMFVGIAFKVAIAPFHVWTPDVYEGAPTPVTGFMSAGPKAAGFAILTRVFWVAFPTVYNEWLTVAWISAVLSMTIGNVVAIAQSNIKRMLAYSSIAHAGYILAAFASRDEGIPALLFYALAYAFMNIGAFTVVALIGRENDRSSNIEDYAGIGFKQPLLAACLSVFLLSLAGIPLTAGFAGKFFIFRAAIKSHLIWLAIIGVVNSAISVYYYLKVIITMYMKEPDEDYVPVLISPSVAFVLCFSTLAILQLGIYPNFVISLAKNSIFSLK
jgi:NADH-quinone oxidoreductase subunit N